jgi:hypothetical protein
MEKVPVKETHSSLIEFTVQGSRLKFWKIQVINPKP